VGLTIFQAIHDAKNDFFLLNSRKRKFKMNANCSLAENSFKSNRESAS
jgi:hypothetical protein